MSNVPRFLADGAIALTERKSAFAAGDSLVLAATSIGCSLVFMSGAVVNVALASIGQQESLSSLQLQWVLNAEFLPIAALTLLCGAIGDRSGHRRLFQLGLFLLCAGSLASALAPNWSSLVAARAVVGLGEALVLPNGLSILGKAYPADLKSRAVGIWSATAALACAVGPAMAGVMIAHRLWRAIFLMNIPVAMLAMALTWLRVPADMPTENASVDAAGAVLTAAGLGTLGWGLTSLTNGGGWSHGVVLALVAALAAFIVLGVWEGRLGKRAMLPPSMLASRTVAGANLYTVLLYGSFTVVLTLIPFVMIRESRLSTVVVGMAFIPLQLLIVVMSPLVGALCRAVGRRPPLLLGAFVTAISCLAALRINDHATYWVHVFPAILLFSIGMSLTVAPLTTLVLVSVDGSRAGTASGVNSTASRAGSLVAIAMLGGVLQQDGNALAASFRVAMITAAGICFLAMLAGLMIKPGPHVDWILRD